MKRTALKKMLVKRTLRKRYDNPEEVLKPKIFLALRLLVKRCPGLEVISLVILEKKNFKGFLPYKGVAAILAM